MKLFDIICLNKYVGINTHTKLNYILNSTPIPADFDVLLIDIDGWVFLFYNLFKNIAQKFL